MCNALFRAHRINKLTDHLYTASGEPLNEPLAGVRKCQRAVTCEFDYFTSGREGLRLVRPRPWRPTINDLSA